MCCLRWEWLHPRHQLLAAAPFPNSVSGCGCFNQAAQHRVTNPLCSCNVNGPTVLLHICLEGTAVPKWIAMIFNTDRRANHHEPMLATDRPYTGMGSRSYLAPLSSWRLADLVGRDKWGREQPEREKAVDFPRALRWGNRVPVCTDFATGQGNDLQLMVSKHGWITSGGKVKKGFGVRTQDLLLILNGNLGYYPCLFFHLWRQ